FGKVSATPAVPSSSDKISAFIGDVDGDGFGDLGVMQTYSATSGYVPAVAFGGPSLTTRSPFALIKSAAGSSLNLGLHAAGDFNGDGFDDFLVDYMYFSPAPELQVFYGGSPLSNQAALHIPCPFPGSYTLSSNGIGDVNGDSYPDIAFTQQGNGPTTWTGRFQVFAGGAAPKTTPVADIELPGGHTARVYPAGDLNGDGFMDAAIVENDVGFTLYKGAASFPQATWKTLADTGTTSGVGGFDINGDGYGDLLLKGANAGIYLGGSTGPATVTPLPTARGLNLFVGVGVSDHDGDGLPDLVGSTATDAFWCASAGTATPTCLQITNNGAAYTGSYAFAR
ncbi:MAG TPA: VCBS repeat-containing protein, partial [Polyangiaceae bacterium]